jgi:EAL domain-containing protein (putative c-di-GMP-specific phosphodiesterase class I)
MKTYQVEIKETLCMNVEIEAENAQQAEAMVQEAYNKQEYILDAEYFTGVEFTTQVKEMDRWYRKHKQYDMSDDRSRFFFRSVNLKPTISIST